MKHLGLERKEIVPLEQVLPFVKLPTNHLPTYRLFGEDKIKMTSQRYQLFALKGLTCVSCGLEGQYFAKERSIGSSSGYHLNLYALTDGGQEVLMTKDHILPKSRGGRDELSNYQTMCTVCNNQKGNRT